MLFAYQFMVYTLLISMFSCLIGSPDGLPPAEDQCSPNPCQNRAICRARGDGYSCFCVPGFQGAHCQIDVNECASEPCRNGATCEDRVGNFSCLCSPGFTGEWREQCRPSPLSVWFLRAASGSCVPAFVTTKRIRLAENT